MSGYIPIKNYHGLKCGDKTEWACESCGVNLTWGLGRHGWWLVCTCWTTDAFKNPLDVLADRKKDTRRRIKSKKP